MTQIGPKIKEALFPFCGADSWGIKRSAEWEIWKINNTNKSIIEIDDLNVSMAVYREKKL